MEKLSSDLLFSLAIHLDLYDVLNLCKTNKEIDRKLSNNWNYKLNQIEDQESVEKLRIQTKRVPKKLYELVYSLIKVRDAFKLEKNIYDLYNRKELNLIGKGIKEIPKELGNLSNLQKLNLFLNQITKIPSEISNLSNLQYLNLSNNKITEIPKELGNLQYLNLSNNKITEIPKELGNLSNLQILDLTDNKIQIVPKELYNLSNLKRIKTFTNLFIKMNY